MVAFTRTKDGQEDPFPDILVHYHLSIIMFQQLEIEDVNIDLTSKMLS